VLDPAKLEALKQAALSDDWKTAADVYLEIALAAEGGGKVEITWEDGRSERQTWSQALDCII